MVKWVNSRDAEFSRKNIPRKDLTTNIEAAILVVKATLGKLSDEDLQRDFPLEYLGKPIKTGDLLMHLYGHLNYHLGQVNYHRRLGIKAKIEKMIMKLNSSNNNEKISFDNSEFIKSFQFSGNK